MGPSALGELAGQQLIGRDRGQGASVGTAQGCSSMWRGPVLLPALRETGGKVVTLNEGGCWPGALTEASTARPGRGLSDSSRTRDFQLIVEPCEKAPLKSNHFLSPTPRPHWFMLPYSSQLVPLVPLWSFMKAAREML